MKSNRKRLSMDYDEIEKALQGFLGASQLFTPSQLKRMVQGCSSLIVAGKCQFRALARVLHRNGRQDSRIQWFRRLLDAPFLQSEYSYDPIIKWLLQLKPEPVWHVAMDRTHVEGWKQDVVMLSLDYRKRSLPLVWCRTPAGRTPTATILHLLQRAAGLIPSSVQIIFHGDCEFGHAQILEWLRQHHWDFIAAQSGQTHFCRSGQDQFQALSSLPVRRRQACQLTHVLISTQHQFGDVNLVAFYQPHHRSPTQRSREIQYLATSLPLSQAIRRLGKRRWGVECLFQDWKSEGWDIESSNLTDPRRMDSLLILVSLTYLWLTLMGRYVCKNSLRYRVDAQPKRHLSLFHIGWDWLIYQWRCGLINPHPSILYF